jgi:ABC-2 type transport system ATP-binding protein
MGVMPEPVIHIERLTKRYGEFAAVEELGLEVFSGEVFGFLGPNGAGKTTTIRMLMGILVPTSGSASILGLDAFVDRVELKRQVGYLPDAPVFYDYLRGREILNFIGQMHNLAPDLLAQRQAGLMDRLGLDEAGDEYAVNYSMGMKKKLALACALIHDPPVLILDEPTNGLDPRASRQLQELISSFANEGKTIFLSTHLLHMAERLCHRVGIIHHGKMAAVGTPDELRTRSAMEHGSLEEAFLQITATQG